MGLRLIVENDRNELSVHEFNQNLITAGRSETNDLLLKERNVSRHHFQLEIVDGRIIINDLGSYNATFVNDREVTKKVEIFVGDVITIGDYNIYLEQDEGENLKSIREYVNTPVKAGDNLLFAKTGAMGGKVFKVKGVETVIGSHAGADIYIFGPEVPQVHSKIIFDGNIHLLIKGDSEQKMPLIVNDMELESVDLRHGDEITVSGMTFEYIEKGEEYNPYPFLMQAEEDRKKKLLAEIEAKKIRSFHDDDHEVTEITRKVMTKSNKLTPMKIVIAAVVLIIFILIALVVFSIQKSKKEIEELKNDGNEISLFTVPDESSDEVV